MSLADNLIGKTGVKEYGLYYLECNCNQRRADNHGATYFMATTRGYAKCVWKIATNLRPPLRINWRVVRLTVGPLY